MQTVVTGPELDIRSLTLINVAHKGEQGEAPSKLRLLSAPGWRRALNVPPSELRATTAAAVDVTEAFSARGDVSRKKLSAGRVFQQFSRKLKRRSSRQTAQAGVQRTRWLVFDNTLKT
jgi:hypothetical protein